MIKRLIEKWSHRLNDLLDIFFCNWADDLEEPQLSYQEYIFQNDVDSLRRDKKYLQIQLTKTRADLNELQQRPQTLRDSIYQVVCMPDDQLEESSRFHVQKSGAGGWETVTGSCCLGGCDMNVYSFQLERDALLFSVLLRVVGYQPPHNIACSNCYEEYMTEKIQGGIEPYAE